MKKCLKILALGLLVTLTNCTTLGKFGCVVEKAVVGGVSDAVVVQLQCKNSAAVEADMYKLFHEQIKICEDPIPTKDIQQTSIGSWVCKKAGEVALNQLAKQIPAAWNCSAENAKEKLKGVIESACEKSSETSVQIEEPIVHPVQPEQP